MPLAARRVVIAAMKPTASSDEWMSSVTIRQRKIALSPARRASSSRTISVRPSLSRNTICGSIGRGARIRRANPLGAPIDESDVLDLFGDEIEVRHDGDFDPATGSVTPTRTRRLGAIRLSSGPDPAPDQSAVEHALVDGVRKHGLDLLPWDDPASQLGSAPRSHIASTRQFHPSTMRC